MPRTRGSRFPLTVSSESFPRRSGTILSLSGLPRQASGSSIPCLGSRLSVPDPLLLRFARAPGASIVAPAHHLFARIIESFHSSFLSIPFRLLRFLRLIPRCLQYLLRIRLLQQHPDIYFRILIHVCPHDLPSHP